MTREIKKCRICGNKNLVPILSLGNQVLTGVFPRTKEQIITSGPLELVKCQKTCKHECCGLLQLRHSYDPNEMYRDNYGYRSSLNNSMINHLHGKVKKILTAVQLERSDIILDIGSNDGTLLKAYPKNGFVLAGIDPIAEKFRKYYSDYIQIIPDFFSASRIKTNFKRKKVKVVTSIAMFYDLESPMDFMKEIHKVLDKKGIWIFEQSYMPAMLKKNAYDTICHEHLEYYSLKQIKWMIDRTGFKILDVEFNDINGGSFSVTAAKNDAPYPERTALIEKILLEEEKAKLETLRPYEEFKQRVYELREELRRVILGIKAQNKKVIGYGASTKGNVILQFCEFTEKDVPFIAEVNEDKFGCYTPGTHIPIISEKEAKLIGPDYLFILPWHFKDNFLQREKEYLKEGGRLLMPLPEIEIIAQAVLLEQYKGAE